MKNIFKKAKKQEYLEGYTIGLNPYLNCDTAKNQDFTIGFNDGRAEYEKMNGKIAYGVPQLIVTNKVLEDFLLAGMLGMEINSDDYNSFQIDIILKWYLSGVEKYNPKHSIYLVEILEENGIEIA